MNSRDLSKNQWIGSREKTTHISLKQGSGWLSRVFWHFYPANMCNTRHPLASQLRLPAFLPWKKSEMVPKHLWDRQCPASPETNLWWWRASSPSSFSWPGELGNIWTYCALYLAAAQKTQHDYSRSVHTAQYHKVYNAALCSKSKGKSGQRYYHPPVNLHNYGKIHHFLWVNPLFLWPFSIANC